jgi:hypothetical protein
MYVTFFVTDVLVEASRLIDTASCAAVVGSGGNRRNMRSISIHYALQDYDSHAATRSSALSLR